MALIVVFDEDSRKEMQLKETLESLGHEVRLSSDPYLTIKADDDYHLERPLELPPKLRRALLKLLSRPA